MNAKIYIVLKSFEAPKFHLRDIIELKQNTKVEKHSTMQKGTASHLVQRFTSSPLVPAGDHLAPSLEARPQLVEEKRSHSNNSPLQDKSRSVLPFSHQDKWKGHATQTSPHASFNTTTNHRDAKVGSVRLPKRRTLYTVLRSPHIDKKSREQFEMKVHKQLITIQSKTTQLRQQLLRLKLHSFHGVQLKVTINYATRLNRPFRT